MRHFVMVIPDNLGFPIRVAEFDEPERAEHAFTQECQAHGVEPVEEHYRRGIMILEDETMIILAIDAEEL